MALLSFTAGSTVVLDETAGLQNSTASLGVPGDDDDNDILLTQALFPTVYPILVAYGSVANTALSGYTGAAGNTGSDAFTVSAGTGAAITDVSFVGPDGQPLAGLDSGLLTLDGTRIFLYTDSTNNNIVLGRVGFANGTADPGNDTANPAGVVAFAGYIQETLTGGAITGGKIWLTEYQPLRHPNPASADEAINLANKVFVGVSQDANFSLAGAPSGQQLFLMWTTQGATADANGRIPGVSIIVTGKDPLDQSASGAAITSADTVNSSQGGGNTTLGTNNQAITEQEGLRFSFVTGARANVTIPNLDPGEAGIESNIDFTQYFGARSATFQVVQETGGTTAMIRLTAFKNADNVAGSQSGVNFINSYANDGTEKVAITLSSITVKTFAGATVSGVSIVNNGDGSVTINGVPTDSQITYATATDHNRVMIENAGSLAAKNGDKTHADFDIGGFKVLQTSVDKIEIGSHMVFEDDGPSITVSVTAAADALAVDETVLATDASANYADNFGNTPSFGADGAAAANSITSAFTLGVSAAGADSGLDDVGTGANVLVYLEGTSVVGRAGSAVGAIVFVVSVTAAGVVSLDQQRALVHPGTTNPDDAVSPVGTNLITLTRTDTITDKDGDTNTGSKSIDITAALSFKDDGPSVVVNQTAAADALTVDETVLATNASANYADNFGNTPSFGADGAAAANSVTSAFTLGVSAAGADSGLDDVGTGANVLVYLEGTSVVGRAGSAAGAIVFVVSVSAAGVVSLDQQRALVHPGTTNPDDAVSPVGTNLITLTRTDTITDKDGDTNTGSKAIDITAALSFKDDGPSVVVNQTAAADALTVDETVLATDASANYADNFGNTPSFGADGAAAANSITSAFTLGVSAAGADSGLDDVATGANVLVYLEGTSVVGRAGSAAGAIVFTVSVSAAGVVSLDQQRALVHPGTTNPDDAVSPVGTNLITLTRTDTITDKDGDTNTGSKAIDITAALSFKDDGPSVVVNQTAAADALTVDETVLATDASANYADNFGNTPSFGADGAAAANSITSAFTLGVSAAGADSGLDDVGTGANVLVYLESGVVVGRAGSAAGAIVFTVSVSAAGVVSLDQQRALVHPGTTNPDDAVSPVGTNLITLTRTDTITDKDGDTNTGSKAIDITAALSFKDDGPSVVVNQTAAADALTVDETVLATDASANYADNFGNTSSFGADGAAAANSLTSAFTLGVSAAGADSGLDDVGTGANVLVYLEGTSVVGRAGSAVGAIVFTVSVTAAGVVSLDQQRALVHPGTTNPDDAISPVGTNLITLTRTDTITDKDGDSNTGSKAIDITAALSFKDDGPSIAFGNLVGTGTDLSQYGFWSKAAGADGPNANDLQIALTGFQLSGVAQAAGTFSLTEATPSPDGSGNFKWTGSLTGDFDNNGTVDANPVTFTLTADPATGKYALRLATPVQSSTTTDTATGALGAGGPDAVQTLSIPASPAGPAETVVFFSAKIGSAADGYLGSAIASGVITGATDPTEAGLQGINPPATLASFIDPRSMNVSTAGIGVDNNNMNGYGASGSSAIIDDPAGSNPSDDSFVVNPLALVDKVRVFIDNSVTGYDYTGGERLQYRIIYADGTVSAYTTVVGDLGKGVLPKFFEIDGAGQKIDAVQLTMLYGEIKIPNIQFVTLTEGLAKDIGLDFTASLTDKDGDTASSNFSADLFTNKAANAAFDYELLGMANGPDAFDVDLASTRNDYRISGFDTTAGARDKIVLIGVAPANAQVSIANGPNATDNSIVMILENGQTTTVTVIGVDLQAADIVFA